MLTAIISLAHLFGWVVVKRAHLTDFLRTEKRRPSSKIRRDIAEVADKVKGLGQFLTQIQARLPPSSAGSEDSPEHIV